MALLLLLVIVAIALGIAGAVVTGLLCLLVIGVVGGLPLQQVTVTGVCAVRAER
jgi:hypothetical protein